MSKKAFPSKVFLLVGRDDWQKDDNLNYLLHNHLKKYHHKIVWEDPAGNFTYKLRRLESKFRWIPPFLRKINLRIAQTIYALFHWTYFIYLYEQFCEKQTEGITLRCQKLKRRIEKLGVNNEIIILSRSSGGRVASLIADDLTIKHIICLGYPFKHPEKEIEPVRYLHLSTLKTPMLIIQGTNDEYGGLKAKDLYSLSPNIELYFIDTNHNFNIDDESWSKVFMKMDEVIININD